MSTDKTKMAEEEPLLAADQQGAAAARREEDGGGGAGFSWLTALGFAFLTFNSGMAIYRSNGDAAAVAFVAFSYIDLVLLFCCLRWFETAARREEDGGGGAGFSWLTALGFAFLTFNSGMAIYRSNGDAAAVAFVAFSYIDLVLLFCCLRWFETAARREEDGGGGAGFSWLTALGFAFLTFNSGMAIYRSNGDAAAVAFVVFSYIDLVLLFCCLRWFETAAPGSPARGKLKVAVWVVTTLLTFVFSYKVAAIMPFAVQVLVWGMAGATVLGGFYAFFLHAEGKVNKPSHFRADSGKFTDDQIVAKVQVVQHTWEPYMGQPMVQKVPDTCVPVACTVCLEAKHRIQHEKLHGKGTTFPYRAAPPDDLLEACRTDGIWNPGVGANVRDVLNKIREMGGVVLATTDAPTRAQRFLPLRSWEEHRWDDFAATALSRGRVADLLYNNGPCIGLLWASPSYHCYDADRDDTLVYTSGCGRSDDARRKIEELYPGDVGWHAVVCFGFRRGGKHVLVLDNHTPTGPRRWIDVEEFHALYTLSV